MNIKQEELDKEINRMKIEMAFFGRYLLVGTGESDYFWKLNEDLLKPKEND